MKTFVIFLLALFAFVVSCFAVETEPIVTDFNSIFSSIGSLVVLVPLIVQFLKRWFKMEKDIWKQLISWVVSLALVAFGKLAALGMFASLDWVDTLIYGIGIGLVTNGVFDVVFIKAFLQTIFGLRKK